MSDSVDRIAADILIAALSGERGRITSGAPAEHAKQIAEAFKVIFRAVHDPEDRQRLEPHPG